VSLTVAHVTPFISLLAGILILLIPALLNYIVAIYLIVAGGSDPAARYSTCTDPTKYSCTFLTLRRPNAPGPVRYD
jgi:hypothetical protein